MRIAVFSGSFNPIHNGHTQLANHLIINNIVDEVWLIVSPCNPLKDITNQLDEYIRLDMVIAAISGNNRIKASDIEFSMSIPSYTIDTLNHLSEMFHEHQFVLIIGSDNAIIFDQWKDYDELLKRYEVYVYPRKGYDFSTVKGKYPSMQVLNTPFFDVSSTQIRQMIQNKQDVSDLIHPDVYDYIKENNLYE
jgi:nicotinate-nucleotide adenylyltransferase